MIYFVSAQKELFDSDAYEMMTPEDSIKMMESWSIIQYDSETSGRDPHLCELLCMQFGDIKGETQIVVDTTTISPLLYKDILESKKLVGQNIKFDLQFLYNYGIIPRNVYDTMIVEQLLHLGYPNSVISYSLQSIAARRLSINIDKTVRDEIIWRGLDEEVIKYAAGDVTYLGDIANSQLKDVKKQGLKKAVQVECNFVPAIAYLEWCGIHLDADKWKEKMNNDRIKYEANKKALDDFVVNNPALSKYTKVNLQGSLFDGFDTTPICTVNWASSQQVVKIAKDLGFNTEVKDKKTGEDKDSVLEKHLKVQKGINDEFLKLYFDFQEAFKVITSFGEGHLNAINPKTDRIHTTFRQLGTFSGRLSCGSSQPNTDLAKFKGLSPKECTYMNLQQLPSDNVTRSCFTAPEGHLMVSADFSAEESRLGADIYQDEAFLKEFTEGSGDTHNMFAWAVFKDQCKACGCKDATEVKKKAPQWRKKVKAVEFAYMFKFYL